MSGTVVGAGRVVQVRDLRVEFETGDGTLAALKGVSLDIAAGEIVALVGESGSGKSVFASCLMGLPPVSRRTTVTGSVQVAGVDMIDGEDGSRREVRRNLIGAVFQDPLTSLDPTMRIGDQVCERGADEARGVLALTDCGVPEPEMRMRQWPHVLSGGLRQRASIAGAISTDVRPPQGTGEDARRIAELTAARDGTPVLLVADEPTTALDVRVQAQIIALFARLRQEHGCSIVLITHDLGVAAQIADRIAVMYAGEICELGPAAEVLAHPQHDYTRRLLAARLDVNKVVTRERPLAPTPQVDGPDPAPVLAVHDIVKTFPRQGGRRGDVFTAVGGVSLAVPPGGSLALVGESGCGKSTLLRIATGLTKPDSGTVEVTGSARPQLVFQDAGSSLTPWLSVNSQLVERLRTRGLSRTDSAAAAADLLERVGLDPRMGRARPRELSGGQRQRAAIARALASSPQILVCDEPVSALDASLAARVLDLLDELRVTLGVAILMVTHDLAVARRIAEDLAVMYAGEIVERGSVEAVFADPQHAYTRDLIAASPTIYRSATGS
ncbi:ATP-binding cassette domain-containing protein [uncultured Friedmanniella sp.]|uniref:ATP-binding cassette domain-containing protein n=1 Tax=uncultured Friedmanniella sp. TaxID=335381 RepID=UPI0035C9A209